MTAPQSRRRSASGQGEPPTDGAEERALAPVPEAARSGEDTRRRGWFWHWNALVTQYAPLIGLKGVGLLNSYTVWTDRREESPHRGYAFPSQQSEADSTASEPPETKKTRFRSPGASDATSPASSIARGWAYDQFV